MPATSSLDVGRAASGVRKLPGYVQKEHGFYSFFLSFSALRRTLRAQGGSFFLLARSPTPSMGRKKRQRNCHASNEGLKNHRRRNSKDSVNRGKERTGQGGVRIGRGVLVPHDTHTTLQHQDFI